MSYYDLAKKDREILKKEIEESIESDLKNNEYENILKYSSDNDTYVRKNVYLAIGKLYNDIPQYRDITISTLKILFLNRNEKVRQTVVYALGEIGKINFEVTEEIFEQAFTDSHHSVLNAVTGALKQLGGKKPKPTLKFVKKHLQHSDPRVRVKLLHGLELWGRTHPEDVLPILAEYQNDSDKKVIKMIVHILGQISYKEGCLKKVIDSLKEWENTDLIDKALKEIVNVHRNYSRFSYFSCEEAQNYIKNEFA